MINLNLCFRFWIVKIKKKKKNAHIKICLVFRLLNIIHLERGIVFLIRLFLLDGVFHFYYVFESDFPLFIN